MCNSCYKYLLDASSTTGFLTAAMPQLTEEPLAQHDGLPADVGYRLVCNLTLLKTATPTKGQTLAVGSSLPVCGCSFARNRQELALAPWLRLPPDRTAGTQEAFRLWKGATTVFILLRSQAAATLLPSRPDFVFTGGWTRRKSALQAIFDFQRHGGAFGLHESAEAQSDRSP